MKKILCLLTCASFVVSAGAAQLVADHFVTDSRSDVEDGLFFPCLQIRR